MVLARWFCLLAEIMSVEDSNTQRQLFVVLLMILSQTGNDYFKHLQLESSGRRHNGIMSRTMPFRGQRETDRQTDGERGSSHGGEREKDT